MKKKIAIIVTFMLLLSAVSFAAPPEITAASAILINAETQEVLFELNATTPLPPASTTKVMTALLILENHSLDEIVDVGPNFVDPGEKKIAINHNEIFTVEELLYAVIVESANDASVALAVFHSGSVEAFAEAMNERAKELGAVDSNFMNPHGLDEPGHLSTAKDLAIISAEAMKNATFRLLVSTQRYTINPTNMQPKARDYLFTSNFFIRDTNKTMIYRGQKVKIYDERIDGIKTGYTTKAGNCLISTLSSGGNRYISVVLGAGADNLVYVDSRGLLDYASEDFKRLRIVSEGDVVTNITVPGAENTGLNLISQESITRTVPVDFDESTIEESFDLYDLPEEPIKTGMEMGTLSLSIGGEVIATTKLLAQNDIETGDLIGSLSEKLSSKPFESPYDYVVFAIKLLIAIAIWRWIIVGRRRRTKKRIREEKLRQIREEIQTQDESSNVYNLSDKRRNRT